jgi:lipopolysaccharide/colanic/teichoic acid biosynthesis glycosyltransferase
MFPMTVKRLSDITLAAILLLPSAVIVAILWLPAIIAQGRPYFYAGERLSRQGRPFIQYKLRTMDVVRGAEQRVLGGDIQHRVTPFGRWLRKTRLDEVPQIWNILTGDMSFVGPRPPIREHFDSHRNSYSVALQDRPGLTGLATVMICGREERILAECRSRNETETAYARRCQPMKLRIDRLYSERKSFALDTYVLYLTLARIMPLPGRRAARLWRDARRPSPYRQPDRFIETGLEPRSMAMVAPQLSRSARLK